MADRIEREIEEILKKIDNFVPERAKPARIRRAAGPPKLQKWLAKISLRKVMMWSLFGVLVAFLVSRSVPGAYWLLIGALIVFITAFLLSTRAGPAASSGAPEKRWRGQPLDLSAPSWPDRIKAWWKGRQRR
jgi:hypothetical protein